jgi:hypothetical protein
MMYKLEKGVYRVYTWFYWKTKWEGTNWVITISMFLKIFTLKIHYLVAKETNAYAMLCEDGLTAEL